MVTFIRLKLLYKPLALRLQMTRKNIYHKIRAWSARQPAYVLLFDVSFILTTSSQHRNKHHA